MTYKHPMRLLMESLDPTEMPDGITEEMVEGAATVCWGNTWADYVEEANDPNSESYDPNAKEEVGSISSGSRIEDIMPPTPEICKAVARAALEEANRSFPGGVAALYAKAAEIGEFDHVSNPEEFFGQEVMYEALGIGAQDLLDSVGRVKMALGEVNMYKGDDGQYYVFTSGFEGVPTNTQIETL